MPKRWTDTEVAFARSIQKGETNKMWLSMALPVDKPETLTKEGMEEMFNMINRQSLAPPSPPWWTQAVEWADNGNLWVSGCGWMREELWEDILKEKTDGR